MDWLWTILGWIWDELSGWARDNPFLATMLLVGFLARFGTVVQTGWTGVLFFFGRACRELEPGFHWLLPLVCLVRKVPVRSVSLSLPAQIITTADGLVYEVQANLVYHIVDPTRSVVQIGDLRQGMLVLLPMIAQQLLSRETRSSLLEARDVLEEKFAALAADRLERWGVEVEQAGFPTITPTRRTLRLTLLARQTQERQRILAHYGAVGLPVELALALLGSERRVISRTANRFRKIRFRHRSKARQKLLALRELRKQVLQHFPDGVPGPGEYAPEGTPALSDQPEPQGSSQPYR